MTSTTARRLQWLESCYQLHNGRKRFGFHTCPVPPPRPRTGRNTGMVTGREGSPGNIFGHTANFPAGERGY